jgi:hypothetical protein
LLQIEYVSWWNYILVYQIRTYLFDVRWYLTTNKQSMTFTLRPSQFVITVIHISHFNHLLWIYSRIVGVMVSVLATSAVDRGFEPQSGKTKDYKIGICCFSAKNAALRSKSKDWLARNQNNVSEWSECLSADCCFSELALCKSYSACLSRTKRTSSSSHWNLPCCRHDIAEKICLYWEIRKV